jgi:hypothetical protein
MIYRKRKAIGRSWPPRRLGDDTTQTFLNDQAAVAQNYMNNETIQDYSSPVPFVAASTAGFSPTQSLAYNLTAPFAQAGASLLAHGPTAPGATVALGSSTLTTWLFVGVAAVVVVMAMRR